MVCAQGVGLCLKVKDSLRYYIAFVPILLRWFSWKTEIEVDVRLQGVIYNFHR